MRPKLFILALTTGLCAVCIGCASTGPPLPPSLELPKPPNDLRATSQRRSRQPGLDGPFANHRPAECPIPWPRAHLSRRRRALDPMRSSCRRGPQVQARHLTLQAEGKKVPQQYVDLLPSALMKANPLAMATYAVEVYNRDHHGGGISNQVRVPLAPTYSPPTDLKLSHRRRHSLYLGGAWPKVHDVPKISHRYRVYRSAQNPIPPKKFSPETSRRRRRPRAYVDQSFEWGKTYLYRLLVVTIVSTGFQPCPATAPSGADCMGAIEIEGDDTPPIKVFANDVFPPAVPTGSRPCSPGPDSHRSSI